MMPAILALLLPGCAVASQLPTHASLGLGHVAGGDVDVSCSVERDDKARTIHSWECVARWTVEQ